MRVALPVSKVSNAVLRGDLVLVMLGALALAGLRAVGGLALQSPSVGQLGGIIGAPVVADYSRDVAPLALVPLKADIGAAITNDKGLFEPSTMNDLMPNVAPSLWLTPTAPPAAVAGAGSPVEKQASKTPRPRATATKPIVAAAQPTKTHAPATAIKTPMHLPTVTATPQLTNTRRPMPTATNRPRPSSTPTRQSRPRPTVGKSPVPSATSSGPPAPPAPRPTQPAPTRPIPPTLVPPTSTRQPPPPAATEPPQPTREPKPTKEPKPTRVPPAPKPTAEPPPTREPAPTRVPPAPSPTQPSDGRGRGGDGGGDNGGDDNGGNGRGNGRGNDG
ncbi:MAG: hypothetical protein IVW55_02760 [Chloroflexi bacterium]|nr:hypothetical protein [Chloroflexota bacterium]